jgi:hypothetical protein
MMIAIHEKKARGFKALRSLPKAKPDFPQPVKPCPYAKRTFSTTTSAAKRCLGKLCAGY